MDKLSLFVPITKIDVEKRLVYGSVVVEEKDKAGEIFDYAGSKPYFEKWSQSFSDRTDGNSVGNLRSMHNKIAAGKFTTIAFDDAGKSISGCAKVVDDAEWNKCLEGVYTGFSFGGKYVKRWQDQANPAMKRYIADPVEVSLVDDPCVKGATFELVKANGDVEVRKFVTAETKVDEMPVITNEQVATKATELAKLAGGDKPWSNFIDQARTDLEAALKVEKKATPAEAATPPAADAKPGEKPDGNEDPDEVGKQVWVSDDLPGQQFAKKADLRKALVEKTATAAAEKAVQPITDAVSKLTAALDIKEGVDKTWKADADVPEAVRKTIPAEAIGEFREAANVVLKAAQPEADAIKAGMAVVEKTWAKGADGKWSKKAGAVEKSTAAPIAAIANKDELKAGVALFDKATNKNVLKRHLIRSAHKLAATDLLPADWPRSTDAKAEKSVGAEFDKLTGAELTKSVSLYSVANLIQLLASVESAEEMAEYQDRWNGGANNVPKALCDRFGAVVVELGDIVAAMLDIILAEMRAEEASEAVERCTPIVDLMKIGARHSKGDVTKLNKAHDLIVELGAKCEAAAGDDANKLAGDGTVQKLTQVTAERDALEKVMTNLAGTLGDMAERVKRIEEQPVARPQTRVVEKGQDGLPIGGDAANASKLLSDPTVLSSLAEMAVRAAQQNPRLALPDK